MKPQIEAGNVRVWFGINWALVRDADRDILEIRSWRDYLPPDGDERPWAVLTAGDDGETRQPYNTWNEALAAFTAAAVALLPMHRAALWAEATRHQRGNTPWTVPADPAADV